MGKIDDGLYPQLILIFLWHLLFIDHFVGARLCQVLFTCCSSLNFHNRWLEGCFSVTGYDIQGGKWRLWKAGVLMLTQLVADEGNVPQSRILPLHYFFFFLPLHYYNYVSYLFFFFLTCFVWWFRTDIGKRDFYYWFWLGEISGKIEPSALHRLLSLLLIKLGLPYGISASCVCQFQKPEAGTGIIHKCLKQTAGDRVEAK